MVRPPGAAGPEWIWGVHAVQELLDRRPRAAERVFVARASGGRMARLLRAARRAGVPVTHLEGALLGRKIGRGVAHQGVAAQVAPLEYRDADELCREAGRAPDGLLVLADRVTDAGNLGAMIRCAAAAGARGMLLSAEGTAGLTAGAIKVAAGAVERVGVAREARPARRVQQLRETGFHAVVLDPRGDVEWDRADLGGRLLVVAGGEERGARAGVAAACAERVRIPLAAGVESLNVATALGVLLFEALRRRRAGS